MSPSRRPLVLVINGPNLSLLGVRDPETYGTKTLKQIEAAVAKHAGELKVEVEFVHSNAEAELVDAVQNARERAQALIVNAGALSHYSYALRDAIEATGVPLFEVHLSNIYAREEFRRHSVLSEVAVGVVCGLGAEGYRVALDAAARTVKGKR